MKASNNKIRVIFDDNKNVLHYLNGIYVLYYFLFFALSKTITAQQLYNITNLLLIRHYHNIRCR